MRPGTFPEGPISRRSTGRSLPESPLPEGVPGVRDQAGVHHAVHAGAEWCGRALLSKPQGGVCLADELQELQRGPAGPREVDPLVQRGATSPGFGVPKPGRVPRGKSELGGLKSGEHYRRSKAIEREARGRISDLIRNGTLCTRSRYQPLNWGSVPRQSRPKDDMRRIAPQGANVVEIDQ